MKKYCAAFICVLLFFSFVACGLPQKDGQAETGSVTSSAFNDFDVVPELPYIQTVTVPYKAVLSPILVGNTFYMAVAKEDRSETDTNRLVAYDLETGEEELLFTSSQELANIQLLQSDGKWLSFADCSLYGGACNIYVMNCENRKITCINKFSSEAPSFTYPVYMNGSVYWIEEEGVSGEGDSALIYGSVYSYDCENQSRKTIAKLNNIYINNLTVSAQDGKVVWFERTGDEGKYYIYDVKSDSVKTIPSKKKDSMNVRYTDGFIYACETDDFKTQTAKELVSVNTATGEHTSLKWDLKPFYCTENYLVGSTGMLLHFFKRDKNTVTELEELTKSKVTTLGISQNDTVVLVDNNKGLPSGELADETTLHIYKLSERP